MNRILLTAMCILIASFSFAQNIELSMGLQGGLMHFSGSAPNASTIISEGPYNYSTNPYGSKNNLGYGAFIQGQKLMGSKFIAGLQIGFDYLKSKADVTQITTLANTSPVPATGSTNLIGRYINANPFIGIRFPLSKLNVDLLAGFEAAYITSLYDEGSATSNKNGIMLKTNVPAKTINIDNRIKAGITLHYDRVGITANYAHGLSNYVKGTDSAHSEIFKFGVSLTIF